MTRRSAPSSPARSPAATAWSSSCSRASDTLSHDAAGNLVDDEQHHTFTYDAWGRLRTVSNQSSGLVAEYRYNGLGFRIAAHTDVTDDGTTGDPDGAVDAHDPWYHRVHNERWQHLATFRGTDASPKERFVWHSAGLDGDAGSSYIDALMLRDRDANTAWHSASDGTLEERVYTVCNWRSDIVARVSAAGTMLEWVTYTPYGLPRAMPAGDTNSDGDWDAADAIAVAGGYDVRKDADLDGTVDSNDVAHASSIAGGYQTLGFAVLSSAAIGATRGYAGYQALPELARTLWHVRHRVLDSELGRWTRRDPLGYVDGMGLYEYVKGIALLATDPAGLLVDACPASCGSGDYGDLDSDRVGLPWESKLIYDSITEAIRKCMRQPNNCLRYTCLEPLIDSFDELCGGCLEDYLRHIRTLIDLWCLHGNPDTVSRAFCDAQYKLMKPWCDQECRRCRRPSGPPPTQADCDRARDSLLACRICIGWYKWFDAVCARGPGGKRDPNRHKKKIEQMTSTSLNCGRLYARCEAQDVGN